MRCLARCKTISFCLWVDANGLDMLIFNMLCIVLCLLPSVNAYSYIKGETPTEAPCPGYYCGRIRQDNGNWSSCQSCPRGYRTNESSSCALCDSEPTFYDGMYLGFMAMLSLLMHWYCIDRHAMSGRFTAGILVQHVCALAESVLAAVGTLLLTEPVGAFRVTSCRVTSLADWYTVVYNPTPNYEQTLSCTQEAVFPLYSMVFLYYTLSLVAMVTVRPWLAVRYLPGRGSRAVFTALYFFPTLVLVHAVFAGILYTIFPYLVMVVSVISVAVHFACQLNQQMSYLLRSTVSELRNTVIVLGHWLLHAYGIIAVTQLTRPLLHSLMLLLVPFPTIFYIVTVRFTDPTRTGST
ncbi:JNK1/MAPK8-associated membrane protein-like [Pollicipes pollicipes]|uniref:JNK1/MAPK8-associated membrane protein-like n=1 Tax=Pollicipes pollicipes TaxID=41117 RepID=UPI00188532F2|nr:JNK1/MAPK8-associated membrane protein-like [Pollicipes pollicipes]